jgi:hypothetical protein
MGHRLVLGIFTDVSKGHSAFIVSIHLPKKILEVHDPWHSVTSQKPQQPRCDNLKRCTDVTVATTFQFRVLY